MNQTTNQYAIGSHVESDSAYGEWIVTEHNHWVHEDEGDMVTIMGRRWIKSRNEYAKNAGRITSMSKAYYDKHVA